MSVQNDNDFDNFLAGFTNKVNNHLETKTNDPEQVDKSTLISNAETLIQHYIIKGEMSNDNGLKAMGIFKNAIEKGVDLTIDRIIKDANLLTPNTKEPLPYFKKNENQTQKNRQFEKPFDNSSRINPTYLKPDIPFIPKKNTQHSTNIDSIRESKIIHELVEEAKAKEENKKISPPTIKDINQISNVKETIIPPLQPNIAEKTKDHLIEKKFIPLDEFQALVNEQKELIQVMKQFYESHQNKNIKSNSKTHTTFLFVSLATAWTLIIWNKAQLYDLILKIIDKF